MRTSDIKVGEKYVYRCPLFGYRIAEALEVIELPSIGARKTRMVRILKANGYVSSIYPRDIIRKAGAAAIERFRKNEP